MILCLSTVRKKDAKTKKFEENDKNRRRALQKNGKVIVPFARVDLYDNGKIYFGEYTFTPAAGLIYYYNQDTLNELGKKLDLAQYD